MIRCTRGLFIIAFLALAACAPAAAPSTRSAGTPDAGAPGQPPPTRSLTLGVRYELGTLSVKRLSNVLSGAQKRIFNASLAYVDGHGQMHPYLAEALPELNSESWRVFPDGRMETTYRLQPNLTWHDGTARGAVSLSR